MKLNRIAIYCFLFLLLIPAGAIAQWLNDGGIKTNILSVTAQSTKVEYILIQYDKRTVDVNGTECTQYQIPGSIYLMEKGMPQLPADRRSIVIPDLAATVSTVVDAEYEVIETLPVMPSKGHFTRNIDPESVHFEFDEFYSTNSWYPSENILLDEPYIVRDLRGQTIQFNPMQYNPTEGKIKICKRIVVEIFNDPNGQVVNPLIRNIPLEKVSKEFNAVYQSLFINYGMGEYDYVPLEETGRLLIIYPTAFASNITPFYNWKIERGITTLLAEYPTQTGTGAAAIKTYIQNLYNSPDGLTFIILVGEASQIPTLYGQYESAPSDPCFVKLAGSDAYPDAFISRISPTSAANLDYVLWKLIRYEKYPDTGPDAAWYLKGTGVASNEGSPPDWQRANLLRDMLINDMYFTQVDQIYDPGATSSQVTTALNDGRSVLNYIGHGSGTSWSTTGFGNSAIHQLSNGYKNPFIIDVACLNGDFTLNECMEEAWIRTGSMSTPRGAIAVYGSSTNASWVPPCDMQNHGMMLLTTRQKQTVGGVSFNGLMHAMDLWGGSTGEGLKLMEQYNIFGDCTMLLTMGITPDSTAPAQITDLAALDPTSNSVTLNWTAPLDSSFLGIVSYDLRYSTTPIVTNNDFENAPQALIAGGPDTSGTPKNYTLHELDFSTQYYFAIKALDLWGNKSVMSNVPVMTTWGAPQITVTPDSMYCPLLPNTSHSDSVMIFNTTSSNSTLDYEIELTNNTFPGQIITRVVQLNESTSANATKEKPDLNNGTSSRGSGGPDLFGYEWIDSNEPNGPDYVWNDISTTGTLVTNWIPTGTYDPKDEGYAGPFQLGFDFKYYGNTKSQVYVSSNGIIMFSTLNTNIITNTSIPNSSIPNEYIAPFWDDLDGRTQGTVHYKQDGNKFIIQFTNWQKYSGTGSLTFQVVLHSSGKIIFYYNNMNATLNSATVGIENQNGTDGLQVAYNANYVQNNLALQFSAEPEWLTANNMQGTVYNGNSIAVLLNFITEGLDSGDYSMDMVISSNDPLNQEIVVPVAMKITSIVPVELSSFTAENINEEVVLNWQTATETNNQGFEIERLQDSKIEKLNDWETIGFVPGFGSSTEPKSYSFSDDKISAGVFTYRLKQIDFDGTSTYSSEVEIEVTGPKDFALYQNYPNPFNPSTTIKFAMPVKANVEIAVYNSLGEKITDLFSGELDSGFHEVEFNAINLSSGIYFYRMTSEKFVSVKKMIIIK